MLIELVVWMDSSLPNNSWLPIDAAQPNGGLCTSVGFVVFEDDDFLVLADTVGIAMQNPTEGLCSGRATIPKSAIEERQELIEFEPDW